MADNKSDDGFDQSAHRIRHMDIGSFMTTMSKNATRVNATGTVGSIRLG